MGRHRGRGAGGVRGTIHRGTWITIYTFGTSASCCTSTSCASATLIAETSRVSVNTDTLSPCLTDV
jgi:hypothetical protein